MRVLHVTPSFVPARRYGGPVESVFQLCRHLSRLGCAVYVLTTNADGPTQVLQVRTDSNVELEDGVSVRYCPRVFRHTVSPALFRRLPRCIRSADVVHLTGVYSFPTIPTLLLCRLLGTPMIWSPRGALQRWEGSTRPGVKWLWEGICRAVKPERLILHATSPEEARESGARIPGVRTVVIPNGVEIPVHVEHTDGRGVLRLIYLGRLHPIKGIENLIDAMSVLDRNADLEWRLVLAGTGASAYVEEITGRVRALGLSEKIHLLGETLDEAKTKLFADADLLVLPSHKENFGMVVVEALAHGVPVIASRGTPWSRLEEIGCGLWVDNDAKSLADAIDRARGSVRRMRQLGRDWMMREFSWQRCAREMLNQYASFQEGS